MTTPAGPDRPARRFDIVGSSPEAPLKVSNDENGVRRPRAARHVLASLAALDRRGRYAARAEGAHRVSLQTEADNNRALRLYASAGFGTVTDVALLHRML